MLILVWQGLLSVFKTAESDAETGTDGFIEVSNRAHGRKGCHLPTKFAQLEMGCKMLWHGQTKGWKVGERYRPAWWLRNLYGWVFAGVLES
jgi:hypothetical protein